MNSSVYLEFPFPVELQGIIYFGPMTGGTILSETPTFTVRTLYSGLLRSGFFYAHILECNFPFRDLLWANFEESWRVG